ncbi:MAG: regulatory protein TetR [Ilumatobacteraceae bacterium]|nr:regulatory protein TetR [Ilumatobacteraceae bacterium]MCU1388311.1 regulatory protein TetR [Ilumatobacteraceae bacterium]
MPDPGRQKAAVTVTEPDTKRIVIDAAVACILERGFYRASSNEIARRAGVTWGVIQHHYGTRERLMLAILEDGGRRHTETFANASITGKTVEERLDQLLDVFAAHYGQPEYLAYMQIALNMDHDPMTSSTVRATMDGVAERSSEFVVALIRDTLGNAVDVPDLPVTIFLALRGFLVSEQLLATMAHDVQAFEPSRLRRERQMLIRLLAPAIRNSARLRD